MMLMLYFSCSFTLLRLRLYEFALMHVWTRDATEPDVTTPSPLSSVASASHPGWLCVFFNAANVASSLIFNTQNQLTPTWVASLEARLPLYSKVRKPKERGENKSYAVHFHRLCKFVEEKASKLSSLGLLWSQRTGRSLTSQLHVRYSESDAQSHFLLIFSPLATKPFSLTFIVFFQEGDKRKGPRGFLQNKSQKSIREMLLWTWLTSKRRHK